MAITAKQVNELRKITGAGMMDCKKALVEADGDNEKAIEILRKKGQKVSAKRADRETSEGVVVARTTEDGTRGVLIAFTCETDFVAKNDGFVALANEILDVAFNEKPATTEELLALTSGDQTINDKIIEMVGRIGEKMEVKHYIVAEGEKVAPYIHSNKKLGVLVTLANCGDADFLTAGKDVGMQIAAMNPIAVSKDSVDEATKEKELEIGREQARAEGKPEQILDKIAQGKLNKFFKDNTLLAQDFVKDSSVSVEKYLDGLNKGMTVVDFKRIAI
ncbi:elongation factor Ts [Fulvitalea axinellae]|uniref:Elongation factor Ts n=1 Tax=Fulvitalea axinellae TaxID=1182444 RepID=A0AAU9DBH1_9BACT|nr:elongation factor Ts [Fulvitalea axinellae]